MLTTNIFILGESVEYDPLDVTAESVKIVEIANQIRYQCTKCGKHYKWKNTCSLHLFYECGVSKKYCCLLCIAKFRRNSDLQKHVVKVHNTKQTKKCK